MLFLCSHTVMSTCCVAFEMGYISLLGGIIYVLVNMLSPIVCCLGRGKFLLVV